VVAANIILFESGEKYLPHKGSIKGGFATTVETKGPNLGIREKEKSFVGGKAWSSQSY